MLHVRSVSIFCPHVDVNTSSPAILQVFYMLAASMNTARVSERCFTSLHPRHWQKPGPFDYWLDPQQIMHLLVLVIIVQLYLGAPRD